MTRAETLHSVGTSLTRRFHTRDPFEIADALGITVMFRDDFGSLKGMYTNILRNRFIMINNKLRDRTKVIVCAHEIGHDQLHRGDAKKNPIKEFMLYDMTSRQEYEANIVAASILLDDDEIADYIYSYNYSAEQIARVMGTDINLVALKIAHMNEIGYDLRPQEYRNRFLK